MKKWAFRILIIIVILAMTGGGLFWYLKYTKSGPIKLATVSNAVKVDQEALAKYQAEQKAKAEQIAKETAAKAAREAAQKTTQSSTTGGGCKVKTYSVAVKGNPVSDLATFKTLAAETLNDTRGWTRAGICFREVASGGNFTLWLSQRDLVNGFSPNICGNDWSCSVGRNVIINDYRWAEATDSWNNVGGSLRDYRHMVINHEVGHWLGHGHINTGCATGSNQLAPIMQQQSMDLRNCVFNSWPLDNELWARPVS